MQFQSVFMNYSIPLYPSVKITTYTGCTMACCMFERMKGWLKEDSKRLVIKQVEANDTCEQALLANGILNNQIRIQLIN